MPVINSENLAWEKGNGLLPAIIQDLNTGQVLMLGYMNEDALAQTLDTKSNFLFSVKRQTMDKGRDLGQLAGFCKR